MKDRLSLIPYKDIMIDKTYTNISEYFLRGNRQAEMLLRASGMSPQSCSDFELLLAFLDACKETAAFGIFSKVVKKLIGKETLSLSAEELWTKTSEALLDEKNKLRASIASSELESVGISVSAEDEFDAHFARCGRVDISPVFCPFGMDSVSLDTLKKAKNLSDIKDAFGKSVSASDRIALFFDGFSFEEPNEYLASRAYEKHRLGQILSHKENDVLKAQLLRIVICAAAEHQKEVMMFLPYAPDVRAMGEVSALIDYIEECGINADITVFAVDAVSACMAQSIVAKKYKNITAAIGLCDNGSDAHSWGLGDASLKRKASLSRTAATILCE